MSEDNTPELVAGAAYSLTAEGKAVAQPAAESSGPASSPVVPAEEEGSESKQPPQNEEAKDEIPEWKKMLTEEQIAEWTSAPMYAFCKGVKWAFKCWQTLHIAVDMKFGGYDSKVKGSNLVAIVINLFGDKKGKVQEFKLQDFIDEYLLQKLNAKADDGSSRWVVRVCISLYDDCVNKKNFEGLAKLLSQRPVFDRSLSGWDSDAEREYGSDYSDEEYDEEYDEEEYDEEGGEGNQQSDGKTQDPEPAESQEPLVDADGWEVVTSKKGRKGR
jgi:hypothetical protein